MDENYNSIIITSLVVAAVAGSIATWCLPINVIGVCALQLNDPPNIIRELATKCWRRLEIYAKLGKLAASIY